jgi:antitoxin CcdA
MATSPQEPAMQQIDKAPKKATNLSLNSKVLEMAREMGMNVSQTVDTLLAEEVKRRYWAKWNEDNREALDAHNRLIEKFGLPLAKYRTWGKALGDGRTKKA